MVALGEVYAGLFGSDDEWTALVREAAETRATSSWPMPLHERYRPLIESKVADLANSPTSARPGPSTPPSSCASSPTACPGATLTSPGTGMVGGQGTGFGVRLILAVAERLSVASAGPAVTAWVILIGFAIAVVGVIVKVGRGLSGDLREDREAHGGRQTRDAAVRALVIAAVVACWCW